MKKMLKPTHYQTNMKILPTFLSLLFLAQLSVADFTVFAAASLTDAMKELADVYREKANGSIQFNFASSGTLARQIDAGAPVDLFISANKKWMDWLEEKGAIRNSSRFNLAANSLVLIAPPGKTLAFDGKVPGRVAVGDFKSVPAGMYAREALTYMGWLKTWQPDLVMGSSVRTVLMYVERGEVAAGIVYASDAKASGKVPIIGTFPRESHSPIIYPAAACSEKESAQEFLEFLKTDIAEAILLEHGFIAPKK
ncbi:molybdate ABC transporter substrate-binding protein [Pontiellaceae bacterium B12219]|nr:molybdate ABC transporter substrate-binding protein [Pontiellaceae bacterium B12219]